LIRDVRNLLRHSCRWHHLLVTGPAQLALAIGARRGCDIRLLLLYVIPFAVLLGSVRAIRRRLVADARCAVIPWPAYTANECEVVDLLWRLDVQFRCLLTLSGPGTLGSGRPGSGVLEPGGQSACRAVTNTTYRGAVRSIQYGGAPVSSRDCRHACGAAGLDLPYARFPSFAIGRSDRPSRSALLATRRQGVRADVDRDSTGHMRRSSPAPSALVPPGNYTAKLGRPRVSQPAAPPRTRGPLPGPLSGPRSASFVRR
jgi:hypothetical protein